MEQATKNRSGIYRFIDRIIPAEYVLPFLAVLAFNLIGYFLEEKKKLVLTLRAICVAVLVLGIVFRTVSGVNYLTDILGAIGFAVPLVVLYSFVCDV